jgi:hypothetical protein
MIPFMLLSTLLLPSKTAYSQPSSDSTIVLSVTDYTKIINGIIRLQELDTLYILCQEDVAKADSQIVNLNKIVQNNDQSMVLFQKDNDILRLNLDVVNKQNKRRQVAVWCTSVVAGVFGVLYIAK